MAKKNTYTKVDLDLVRDEIISNVNYLASIDLSKLDDEIKWVTLATGQTAPKITTSVEEKLNSFSNLLKDTIEQLKYVIDSQKEVTATDKLLLIKLKGYLDLMEMYFKNRPIESLVDRVHEEIKTSKRGTTYKVELMAANVPQQINNRSKIFKHILTSKPLISQIEDFSNSVEIEAKGRQILSYRLKKVLNI